MKRLVMGMVAFFLVVCAGSAFGAMIGDYVQVEIRDQDGRRIPLYPATANHPKKKAYAEAVKIILRFDRPMLVVGGGGYNVENTVRGWALAWSVLCGDDTGEDHLGLGGVMLETTEWRGGLRDRVLIPSEEQKRTVEPAIDATIRAVTKNVFPLHGLG